MLNLSKRTMTLDISSAAIRLLMTNGKRVERWASAPLEPGLIKEGLISDPLALGARLKHCIESSKMKGGKVVASISGLYSISRLLSMAKPAGQSVQQDVIQAAMQTMPVSTEEFYLSWQMVSEEESNQQVFVLAMPKNLVDAEVQALRSGGVDPHVLNLKGMALARLIDRQQALIINMEPDSIDIVLIVKGIPQIMRTIPQSQNVPVEDRVEQLIQTLDHITYFYDTQHPQDPLNSVVSLYLVGQFAENPDIVEVLKGRIPYPIMPLAIPLEYPGNLPVYQYAVNIGLALKPTSVPQRIEDEQ